MEKRELEQWVDNLYEESDQRIFEIFERIISLGHLALQTIENGEPSQ
jgi:DNA-binding ferritin-like protein